MWHSRLVEAALVRYHGPADPMAAAELRAMERDTDGHGRARAENGREGLIPKHGGYRNTKTWNLAELIYDVTVRFCDRYVDPRSRTHDQMVQAARSGSRNLSEGSVDSGTSKKIEMKLTGIALGSLDELRCDYSSFLRHHGLPEWPPDHPALKRFKARRCATLDEFRAWVADEVKTDTHGQARTNTDGERPDDGVGAGPCSSVSPRDLPAALAANGALSLLNLCMHLVRRQLAAQAKAFEEEGGFTDGSIAGAPRAATSGTTDRG